jgi:hypothetical protein
MITTVMALALFARALLEAPPELVELEPLDRLPTGLAELRERPWIAQPFEQSFCELLSVGLCSAEVRDKCQIEVVEVTFRVNEQCPRREVEAVERALV